MADAVGSRFIDPFWYKTWSSQQLWNMLVLEITLVLDGRSALALPVSFSRSQFSPTIVLISLAQEPEKVQKLSMQDTDLP